MLTSHVNLKGASWGGEGVFRCQHVNLEGAGRGRGYLEMNPALSQNAGVIVDNAEQ